jgi:hypothetical protein
VPFWYFALAICLSGENDNRARRRRNGINILVGADAASNRCRTSPTAQRGARPRWFCEGPRVRQRICRVSIVRIRPVRKRSGGSWYKRMRYAASWRDLMNDRATRRVSGSDIPPSIARGGDTSSLLVDSAISHCEKLRRVLELKEWIDGTSDNPILATTCRKWREERAQLVRELHLE